MKLNINKKFFSDNYIIDIFMFISAVISLLATNSDSVLLCKHKKLQVVLHQVKEVGTVMQQTNCECRTLAYIGYV